MNKEIDFLKTVAIFTSLNEKELETILKRLKVVQVKKGKSLFKEGDKGNEMYIVGKGLMASSIKCPDGSQKELAAYAPGEYFGDMSIFEKAPRSATCFAKEDSSLYRFNGKDFFKLSDSHPDFAIKIMYKMLGITTKRLQNTSKFLSDMVRWGNDASKRAVTDEMTGVYNRRYIDNAMDDIFNKSKTENKPLSFIMMDLDYFREINTCYDHKMGDKSILEIVKAFKKHLREQDSMARYGGDEFTVILRDTNCDTAWNMAETIRKEVGQVDLLKNLGGKITSLSLSMGVATFPDHAATLADLKVKADQALYKAKETGRNRVLRAE